MAPIRVLLVDDNQFFARASRCFFDNLRDLAVVGAASTGEQAIDLAASLTPDLIVMDLAMPGMGGLAATSRIKQRADAPKVLILTLHDTPVYRARALESGADGIIAKDDMMDQVPGFLSWCFPEWGGMPTDGLSRPDGHYMGMGCGGLET